MVSEAGRMPAIPWVALIGDAPGAAGGGIVELTIFVNFRSIAP